jgi:arylsulfatase A-like enzyme
VPLFKLSNLIAYVASLFAATIVAFLVNRSLSALFLRLEGACNRAGRSLKMWTAIGLSALNVVIFLPGVYGQKPRIGDEATTSSATVGKERKPNVLFILIDTLRADHLPIYGYSRQTAPNLTALARESIVFNRMYASTSWTAPSVATIFTSLYPEFHTVSDRTDVLPSSVVTLSEILKVGGYKTFGVSANVNVSPIFGFSQGFEEFWVAKQRDALRVTTLGAVANQILGTRRLKRLLREKREVVPRAETITDIALKFASESRNEPFFAYVHYIDPHVPYAPPSPYDRAFDYRSDSPLRSGGVDPQKLIGKGDDPERVAQILDQYDGEILYTDHQVARLLKGLKEMGVLDNALVIITADHGEEFFEHGKLGHRETLYEEVIHVPFLMHWPGRIPKGRSYDGIAGLIDVLPTILDLLGMKPPPGIQGKSFAAQLAEPNTPKPERSLFAQLTRISFSLEMVLDGRHKLIRHADGPKQGFEELYDLRQDPLERTNIAAHSRPQLAPLKGELTAFNKLVSEGIDQVQAERVEKLDKNTERTLKSLGYIN